MSGVKGVLFDKDGVLVDFDATWNPAAAQVMKTLSNGDAALIEALAAAIDYDFGAQSFLPSSVFIAGTSSDLVAAWSPLLPEMPKPTLARRARELFTQEGAASVTAYDDVETALIALGMARIALGIATNDDEISARTQMRKLRLDGRFSFVAGADSGHGAKPEPGMLLAFADHIGAAPAQVMMVGDSTHDLHAARAAGMIAVAVGTGPALLDDLRPHADHAITRLGELPVLISGL